MNWPERFLHDLVAVPSPTGRTDDAVGLFVRELSARGFDARRDEAGNAVAVAGRGDREILLVGHIDTVPGDLPVRVTEDGFLTGRGSVDAKGALAAFAAAAEGFLDDGRVRIVVVGACDEEGESHGARHLIPRHRPEALVIGEPSGVDGVTIGYKGIVKIGYSLEEDLHHTGAPFPTVADRAVGFWSAVQGYLAPLHGESMFGTPTAKLTSFNTTLLASGRDRVEVVGNVRVPPGFDVDAFLGFLKERAGNAKLDIPEWSPAHVASKNTPLSRAFVQSIREEGLTPRYVKKTGTSDMNLLAPAWGCPVVAYGPGDAALDHTPRERVSLDEFRRSVRVLTRAIESIAGAPPG